jgi:hypothetical protein
LVQIMYVVMGDIARRERAIVSLKRLLVGALQSGRARENR